jgi:glycosyltransferase involved in cell wall biosynthesis
LFHLRKQVTLETSVLRRSNKVFVISRTMKEKLLERYNFLAHKDITIIPHGFDAEDFIPDNNNNINYNYDDISKENKKLVITHCGLFPDDRTPKYFLKAINKFLQLMPNAKQHLELRFVGIMKKQHIKLINKYKLDDISVLTGYLPHKQAVKQVISSDVL